MKNKFLKNCLALFVITLVAGVSLAFVNEVTKEPIAKAQDKARLEAYEVVYPNAEFKVMDNSDEILKASSKSLEKERKKHNEVCMHRLRLGVRRERRLPGGRHRPRYALERGAGGF